jgi:hypothetical protein
MSVLRLPLPPFFFADSVSLMFRRLIRRRSAAAAAAAAMPMISCRF